VLIASRFVSSGSATAPDEVTAMNVTHQSGEFEARMPTTSPFVKPLPWRKAARFLTSRIVSPKLIRCVL
jgi:hypothetical protein